jgi:hypothetical protein
MTAKKLMSGEVVDGNAIAQTTSSRESCLDKAFLQNVRLVVNGVFEMTMSGWRVNRPFLRANRKITKPIDRAEPLTLERLGSDSPLNLPEGWFSIPFPVR